jgi:hypothetical protein
VIKEAAMQEECPIGPDTIDNNAARLTAFFISLLALAAAFDIYAPLLIGTLFLDFLLRSFFKFEHSPFGAFSGLILNLLKIKPRGINGAQKKFAAGLGLFMSVMAGVFTAFGLEAMATAVLTILFVFASLEAYVNFCMGCFIYSLLKKAGLAKK